MNAKHYKNKFKLREIEGKIFVIVSTSGKNKVDFIVDKDLWEKDLYRYNWTGVKNGKNRIDVKTSINGITKNISRIIGEIIFDEIDIYGRSIDHINVDALDNRVCNLRCTSTKVNMNNMKDFDKLNEYDYIQCKQNKSNKENSNPNIKNFIYVVNIRINGKSFNKGFKHKEEAIKYRNKIILDNKYREIEDIKKKDRDIEFERGLKEKLEANEKEEVINILNKYDVFEKIKKYGNKKNFKMRVL